MTTTIANNDFQLLCLISTRLLGNTPLVYLMGDGSLAVPVYKDVAAPAVVAWRRHSWAHSLALGGR
jgi:hypothetical protein